ncbi:MAG: hypothetical protein QXK06_01915, partial [Candidatus Diapherotrites archaeon]
MRTKKSLFTALAISALLLMQNTLADSFTINLFAYGDNYVSIPLENANLTLATINQHCSTTSLTYWNPITQEQITTTDPNYTLTTGTGYK